MEIEHHLCGAGLWEAIMRAVAICSVRHYHVEGCRVGTKNGITAVADTRDACTGAQRKASDARLYAREPHELRQRK